MNARAIELDFDVMWHIFFWGFLYIYEYRWTGTYYSMLNNIRCRLNKYSQMCTCYRFEKTVICLVIHCQIEWKNPINLNFTTVIHVANLKE